MNQSEPAAHVEQPDERSLDCGRYRWLAHELHDGLLQWVVSARMQVEAGLSKQDVPAAGHENFAHALDHLERALVEGRSLIGYLDDQALGDDDVEVALERLVQALEPDALERGQVLRLEKPSAAWPRLPKQIAWSLLRLLQQAVQNAIQHAGPATIKVCLGRSETIIEVGLSTGNSAALLARVEDDGIGFDTTVPPRQGHYGLQSLYQRARMCGASLTLDSHPGQGTRVVVEIPWSEPDRG